MFAAILPPQCTDCGSLTWSRSVTAFRVNCASKLRRSNVGHAFCASQEGCRTHNCEPEALWGLCGAAFHSHKLSSHSLNEPHVVARNAASLRAAIGALDDTNTMRMHRGQARGSCWERLPTTCSHHCLHSAWPTIWHTRTLHRQAQSLQVVAVEPRDANSSWLPPSSPGLLRRPQMPTPEKLQQLRSRPEPQQQLPAPPSPPQSSSTRSSSQGQRPSGARQRPSGSTAQKRPLPTRVLGIDYGTSHTGLAIGSAGSVRELQVIKVDRENRGQLARDVVDIAVQQDVQGIVVGLPLDPYNPRSALTNPRLDSPHATRCRWFSNALAILATRHGIDVYLVDESGTSTDALRMIGLRGAASLAKMRTAKERLDKKVDTLSAALIAQRFLAKPGAAVRVIVRDGTTLDDLPAEEMDKDSGEGTSNDGGSDRGPQSFGQPSGK